MLIHRPAVYEHAAALLGLTPDAVAADAGLLAQAQREAQHRYALDHVVVAMDIYGADAAAVAAAAGRTPESLADLAAVEPSADPTGPKRNVLAAARQLRGELPDSVGVHVPVTAAFSLAAQLVGFESLLIGMIDDRAAVEAALDALTAFQDRLIAAAGAAGAGVTIFESAAAPPLVAPRDFRDAVAPRLARLTASAERATGRPADLVLGGATAPILDDLLALRPGLVICDAACNESADFLARCRAAGVELRVNLSAGLLLPAHRVEAHQALERLARLARGGSPLYVAAGIVPFDAYPQNVLAFGELVRSVNEGV